ncbi:MAG TPA: hypothetical protein VLT62_29560 [Candidatus Methylomirabilis sp.]|nr:hypothetical protein [Candidatus Methylomirabilis sp.]
MDRATAVGIAHLHFGRIISVTWQGVNYDGPGGGRYEDLGPDCITVEVFGCTCQCLGLERLIQVKRAADRPRDLEAVAELETILEEQESRNDP